MCITFLPMMVFFSSMYPPYVFARVMLVKMIAGTGLDGLV